MSNSFRQLDHLGMNEKRALLLGAASETVGAPKGMSGVFCTSAPLVFGSVGPGQSGLQHTIGGNGAWEHESGCIGMELE